MKKTFKALFLTCLMASPFVFSACEMEYDPNTDRVGYDEHDDDWGKSTKTHYTDAAVDSVSYNVN